MTSDSEVVEMVSLFNGPKEPSRIRKNPRSKIIGWEQGNRKIIPYHDHLRVSTEAKESDKTNLRG